MLHVKMQKKTKLSVALTSVELKMCSIGAHPAFYT